MLLHQAHAEKDNDLLRLPPTPADAEEEGGGGAPLAPPVANPVASAKGKGAHRATGRGAAAHTKVAV